MGLRLQLRSWRVWAVFLAVMAVAVVAAMSLVPNHGHNSARGCEICQTAHLPYVQTPVTAVVYDGSPVLWDAPPESATAVLDPALIQSDSRAPPA